MTVGTRLGSYEILGLLGAGGMGEVYRARDTKLKRDVALKVLPEAFSSDPGRMARFQREAQVLASLNHPNIAHIYGVEEQALVMELVEGDSPKGPMPFEDAWKIALQIADALEYAHEKGIIHRDLKPANLKVTPEGVVKVLDFGLAKALDEDSASAPAQDSPTLTLGPSRVGAILGTAAYMSPEQAIGKPADRRSDVWSFGAVLYEMLTGAPAFTGDSVPEILAAVVKVEPNWNKIPGNTPLAVRRLLERCLTKDRKQRLQAIGEARICLESPGGTEIPRQSEARATRWAWLAIAAVLALAALSFVHFRENPAAQGGGALPDPATGQGRFRHSRAGPIAGWEANCL
jgi:serine/threonine-protein kinase